MEFDSFLSAISGAFIGGVLTGYFTLKATNKTYEHQKEQIKESEEQLIKGLLQSIHDEIETVFERFKILWELVSSCCIFRSIPISHFGVIRSPISV
ncbi:MAG: hypothetical protein ACRCTB_12650 [Vibrio sp.]